jgi:hypothetical protein
MKTLLKTISGTLLMASMFWGLSGCKDSFIEEHTYTANVPIYMSWSDLRKSSTPQASKAIVEQGKIYIKDSLLFVNEKYKGIHVFDNSNPATPQDRGFIEIPGNVDMAIKGNFLYADSYVDLVVFDISDIGNPTEVYRLKDIFPYTMPETTEPYPISKVDTARGVIVGWKVERVTERTDQSGYTGRQVYYDKGINSFYVADMSSSGSGTQIVGVGGSLARFIIFSDQLYALNNNNLQMVDISNSTQPLAGNKINLMRSVETLFVESGKLFIGTQTGMLIYDLATPANPVSVSEYNHFQSCDPVVVSDGYAYVTMRSGNRCGNFTNLMDVVDLRVINNPLLVKSYTMSDPYGLGIDNKTLFVCDGSAGLKVYDVTDPLRIDEHLIKTFPDINATDAIPVGSSLIVLATDGIYQYDYSDLQNIVLLSHIPNGK